MVDAYVIINSLPVCTSNDRRPLDYLAIRTDAMLRETRIQKIRRTTSTSSADVASMHR